MKVDRCNFVENPEEGVDQILAKTTGGYHTFSTKSQMGLCCVAFSFTIFYLTVG